MFSFHITDFVAVLILLPAEVEVLHFPDAIASRRMRCGESVLDMKVKSPLHFMNLP